MLPCVQSSKSFFSEVIASVSDVRFSCCGRYMLSRDYMHARLWDVRMNRTPLRRFQAHEHLWSKLCDLYENEAIFDKFGCAMSGNGQHVATGSYNNQFRVYNAMSDSYSTLHANRDPLANTPVRHLLPLALFCASSVPCSARPACVVR